ncbi:MAG: hypothetical protein QOK48_3366, partial [Blastocatellia bacterium]|nr:hypothetical protein [Blastocatellia bacterium]
MAVKSKNGSATFAPGPINLGVNHAGARADVGYPATGFLSAGTSIKASTVILNLQIEYTRIRYGDAHLNVLCAGVAADIAQGLLGHAINLDLHAGRQIQLFIKAVVAIKFVFEFTV